MQSLQWVVLELTGNVGTLDLLLEEARPVVVFEIVALFYLLEGPLSSLAWIFLQKSRNELLDSIIFQKFRKSQLSLLDAGIHRIGVVLSAIPKRQLEAYELIQNAPQRPQVNFEGVAIALEDLGRHVVRRPDDGEGLEEGLGVELLGCAQIDEVDLAPGVDD